MKSCFPAYLVAALLISSPLLSTSSALAERKPATRLLVSNAVKTFGKILKSGVNPKLNKDRLSRKKSPPRKSSFTALAASDSASGPDSAPPGPRKFSKTVNCGSGGSADLKGTFTPSSNPYGSDLNLNVTLDTCGGWESGDFTLDHSARYTRSSIKSSSDFSGSMYFSDCGQGIEGKLGFNLQFASSVKTGSNISFSTTVTGTTTATCAGVPLFSCSWDHKNIADPDFAKGCTGVIF